MSDGTGETLILCGIKPDDIIAKYVAGDYANYRPKKPAAAVHKVEMVAQHGNDAAPSAVAVEAVYDAHRPGKSGNAASGVYRIYTSNHAMYAAALAAVTNSDQADVPLPNPPNLLGLKCHWCHGLLVPDTSEDTFDRPTLPPATLDPKRWPAMLVTKYWRRGDVHYFEGEGMYCDTRCVESHRAALGEGGAKATKYRDAGPIVRMYHALLASGSVGEDDAAHPLPPPPLVPRPHWSLLQEYGGSMSREEYVGVRTIIKPLPHVVHLPTKYEYETKIVDT